MANLLSVNGKLKSLYYQAGVEEERSSGYKVIDIGQPLVVRYLFFFLNFKTKGKREQIMISTFIKTAEEKQGAAEAINYYNPKTVFKEDMFRLTDFGGEVYGHELCYYTKSYLGESLRLTTKIMELDKIKDEAVVNAIQEGISRVSALPAFAEFLPYAAMAKTGVSAFAKIVDIFNRDDVIVDGHDLDLHFNRNNARRLQSGRIVCIPGKEEKSIMENYMLRSDNRLVEIDNSDKEYVESSYFVLQLNNEMNRLYENFDHFQSAADLLQKTNRGGDPKEFADRIVSVFQGYNDIDAVRKIEDLAFELEDEDSRKKLKALYKSMSPDMKRVYQTRINELLAQRETY
jgi:hypothetical protein